MTSFTRFAPLFGLQTPEGQAGSANRRPACPARSLRSGFTQGKTSFSRARRPHKPERTVFAPPQSFWKAWVFRRSPRVVGLGGHDKKIVHLGKKVAAPPEGWRNHRKPASMPLAGLRRETAAKAKRFRLGAGAFTFASLSMSQFQGTPGHHMNIQLPGAICLHTSLSIFCPR